MTHKNYIEKISKLGSKRIKQGIKETKGCIKQCKAVLKELPEDERRKKELQFYRERLANLKSLL